ATLCVRAEDGIRDFHVTGVQTCALPIWFCRWDASQQLALQVIGDMMQAYQQGKDVNEQRVDERLISAYRSVLQDQTLDQAMVAYMLTLPSEAYISELADEINVEASRHGRAAGSKACAGAWVAELGRTS